MSLTAILAIKDWKWQWYLEEKQPSVETTELWLHTPMCYRRGWMVCDLHQDSGSSST